MAENAEQNSNMLRKVIFVPPAMMAKVDKYVADNTCPERGVNLCLGDVVREALAAFFEKHAECVR